MDVINLEDMNKFTYLLIGILSITFVIAQGFSNSYLISSVEGSQLLTNKEPKIIAIQDNSENEDDSDDTKSADNLPGNSNEGSSVSNDTGGLSDGLTSGGPLLGSNQTQGDMTANEESSDNTNQTTQTESQVNQNVNQTQTTNQNMNVNQTNNQNMNVNQTNNQNVNVINKQKLELIITEEEDEAPISVEEQTRVESSDKIVVSEHRGITGPECKSGNVLAGASNAEDLRVLADCQDATGTVMHTKKMDDGDYKFFLNVDNPFKFLVNEKNNDKTEGFLVVEIVPAHQNSAGALPKEGDHVHVWGAWVTDKPKGWHEIHPAWKVVVQ
jgi:hypothetical protein